MIEAARELFHDLAVAACFAAVSMTVFATVSMWWGVLFDWWRGRRARRRAIERVIRQRVSTE